MFTILIKLIILLFGLIKYSNATRLPLEVFEISQSTKLFNSISNSGDIKINNNNNNNNSNINNSSIKQNKNVNNYHQIDRRRSRQMLDLSHIISPRILYQIGDSEEDLPICAPNAVCSKIDLYETPWIERQCRCPDINLIKTPIIIKHHKEHKINEHKYHELLEAERILQHKRLLDIKDDKVGNVNLKKLIQKLGAVYNDDLIFDNIESNENDKINFAYPNHKNELLFRKEYKYPLNTRNYEKSKFRHTAHKKDIKYINGCPSGIGLDDGHTIADKTRHYKLCNPIHRLPLCKYFQDYTWTLTSSIEMNTTEQVVHCRCPHNSVTYLTKREPLSSKKAGYSYHFACSPQSRLRCQRKEPCKLFTVRKRQEFLDEVNINPLCQCPRGHRCPKHHTDPGVITGISYIEDNIQTYSGYCMAN